MPTSAHPLLYRETLSCPLLRPRPGSPSHPGPSAGQPAHLLKDAVVPYFVGGFIPHDQNLRRKAGSGQVQAQSSPDLGRAAPRGQRGQRQPQGRVL